MVLTTGTFLGGLIHIGERQIPAGRVEGDWETPATLNDTWGYKTYDHNWKSVDQLLHLLVDLASKGVNYLLNVGPTAEGVIPAPSVSRLREIGKWMKRNGEAIYGTHQWKVTNEGKVRYTTKGSDVYAICTEWPGETLVLKTPKPAAGATVTMLGHPEKVGWRMHGENLHIDVPQLTVDKLPCRHAWVFRLPGAA